MSLVELWPVAGIRVTTADVELSVPGPGDLELLARLAAEGIYDPQNHYLPRTPVGGWEDVPSPEAERRFLRYVWSGWADWRPDRWNLLLAARADGDLVGVQEVGAQDFALTRTVSTGSWIARRFQGRGHGQAMRTAVLHLAFDGLHAERADTAAWATNHASLGVSRALGYRENGTTVRSAEGRRVEQVNLTLPRSDWHRPADDVTIIGLGPEAAAMLGIRADAVPE